MPSQVLMEGGVSGLTSRGINKVRDFTKRSHPISFERDQCLRVPSERQRRVYFRSDFLSTDFADSDRYPGPRRMMVLALG